MIFLLFYFTLVKCYSSSYSHNLESQELPDLYWNSTNPIFQISNTDHIIDVNSRPGLGPHQYDRINIICPQYPTYTQLQSMERHIIYNVNKEEYDSCTITNNKPRIIAYCKDPYESKIFTVSFRSFSPIPNSFEFHPGKSYYFISTSSKNNLKSKRGGYCLKNNMKVVFNVGEASRSNSRPQAQARARQIQQADCSLGFLEMGILTINETSINHNRTESCI